MRGWTGQWGGGRGTIHVVLALVKLLQSLVKALNSEGTPAQVGAGIALGAALGLTPFLSLHNLVIVAAIILLNVSVPGALLGWALFTPLGFALDSAFDALGQSLLLSAPPLHSLWAWAANAPVVALARLNNSVVLGSLVVWLVAALPIWGLARIGVAQYRAHVYPVLARSKTFKAVTASKLYNLYRLFRP
jgi:uncharacterized protein (TIGR03546 family)